MLNTDCSPDTKEGENQLNMNHKWSCYNWQHPEQKNTTTKLGLFEIFGTSAALHFIKNYKEYFVSKNISQL